PFTLLDPGSALWVWHVVNLALLLATLLMLLTELRANRERSLSLAALALLYGPLSVALFWGQLEPVLLFLLYLGLRWSRLRKDWRCGVILALAGVLKVNPLFVLGQFVVLRRWRVCASAILTGVAAGCLSAWRFGAAINVEFVRRALDSSVQAFTNPYSISIITMTSKMLPRMLGGPGLYRAPSLVAASLAGLVVAVMTVAGTLSAHRDGRDEVAYGLWVAGSVLLTPVNWAHELVLLLIPMAQMVEHCSSRVAAGLGLASYFFAEVGLIGFWLWVAAFQYHAIEYPTWTRIQPVYPLGFFASMLLLFFSVWC